MKETQSGLRTGFTTGACAAASAKAAALALSTGPVTVVKIKCPTGEEIEIPIKECEVTRSNISASQCCEEFR